MTIISTVADGCDAVIVSWSESNSDDVETATVTLEWHAADYSVGLSPGWVADGDAPEDVLSAAAEWASERARDQYEDREPEYSRDGAW